MRKMAAAALAAMMAVSVLTGCASQTKETAAKAEETKTESAGNVEAAGTASTTFPEKILRLLFHLTQEAVLILPAVLFLKRLERITSMVILL